MKIQTKRYDVRSKKLKNLIHFYWQIESNLDVDINYNLLPIKNTDLIFNFSAPIEYLVNGEDVLSTPFHFSSIKNQSYCIRQSGKINVFGISFLPHGLYYLLKKPMSTFNGQIVNVENLNIELISRVRSISFCNISVDEKISQIEEALLNDIDFNIIDNCIFKIFKDFYFVCDNTKIKDFCAMNKISIKHFERIFLRVVGITPKQFQCLNRYQNAVNSLIYRTNNESLSELSSNLNYFDQTHFNKEFMKYSGYNPTLFLKNKMSVKQNSEFI